MQVGYLGFLGTSGGGFIDYLIADPVCVPPAEAACYSEQLVHLPECCLVFGEARAAGQRFRRLDFGLPEDGFVFCSLNANAKLEPVMFEVWMALLPEVPGSVLWLYRGSELRGAQPAARGQGAWRREPAADLRRPRALCRSTSSACSSPTSRSTPAPTTAA